MMPAMYELRRTVRFCLNPGLSSLPEAPHTVANGFAGWPAMTGLGTFYELEVACEGPVDTRSGILLNITELDAAVRRFGLPILHAAHRTDPAQDPGPVLARVFEAVAAGTPAGIREVCWRLSPYYSISMSASQPDRVVIAQQFEFAASHRLHAPGLTDDENRRLFGKCNNPNGHGHNYRLEVAVEKRLECAGDGASGGPTPDQIEAVVHEAVIRRFDHHHLNLDITEFAGANPSVEQIAKVCHDLLAGPIGRIGGRLQRLTIWETSKTSCTYPADSTVPLRASGTNER
jgi:6-pyruvoyltetrahydropterin/6-carboxytetrahydropterin synthase